MSKEYFDNVIDRKQTYSTQWDYAVDRFGTNDVLPFSISDTDFRAPIEVVKEVTKVAEFGIYGYTRWNHEDFKQSIIDYYHRRHHTNIQEKIIVYSPSVMYTMGVMIRELSSEGDEVVTFSPMYDAFYKVIEENDRKLLESKLIHTQEGYRINWEDLEKKLETAKIFIHCSPHNPTGRVWTESELMKVVQLCKKNDIWIISDEIHSDVIHTDRKHLPILNSLFEYDKIFLISSSSKTFNTPGLGGSYAIFNDQETSDLFVNQSRYRDFVNSASLPGIHALMTAYNQSDDYIEELKEYVYNNYLYFKKEIEQMSHNKIRVDQLESTYLIWFNIERLEISPEKFQELLINVGHLGIMSGENYGDEKYIRINIGCPKSKLEEAMRRLKIVFQHINDGVNL